jgi:hypothetical protein
VGNISFVSIYTVNFDVSMSLDEIPWHDLQRFG